nr:MAG TPA: hypothetical protein [Caudoviricetes sp.]
MMILFVHFFNYGSKSISVCNMKKSINHIL